MAIRILAWFWLLAGLAACASPLAEAPTITPTARTRPALTPVSASTGTPAATTTRTPLPTDMPQPTATSAPTATAPPTATPDPFAQYAPYTIEGLRQRWARGEFGTEGPIEIVRVLEETPNFTRYLFAYRGDGLRLTGMINRPHGAGPFPVVILNHGYYPLDVYQTGNGTQLAADYLANRGFLTLSPDFRSHAGSDDAPNLFRAGHVIDVLHLIPLAQQLPEAQPGKIGMWGHSNGGAITAKAMVVSDQIGAALIYAPASLNIAEDYRFRAERWAQRRNQPPGRRSGVIDRLEIEFPVTPDQAPELYRRLSPLPYLQHANLPVQIHWGTADETVPRAWPEALYQGLVAAGQAVEWFEYPGQPHSFRGAANQLYLQRMAAFFQRALGGD
ncbi:alpha/beta hydrolase family protein [Kallotenue papyrolyticum]|uniref:alpha/beta hydrolase family protein n=1 Tax=Kallotenue papyrolyticum TaxID=1325125 RepID=UPI00047010C7|nr:prolyl oligopeptidase family serine peptidase [Kallotenue papyrolyticum]